MPTYSQHTRTERRAGGMMTWTFHEHERFHGYGWIEPIMHLKWHLLDIKVGSHIVDEHNREIESANKNKQEPYKWPNP